MAFEWKHLFRREMVEREHLRFLTDIKPYEDQIFNIDAALCAQRIYVDDTILYNYIQNDASVTAQLNQNFSPEEEFARLERVYMTRGCPGSALALGRRFGSFASAPLLKEVTTNAPQKDHPEITFIRLCL